METDPTGETTAETAESTTEETTEAESFAAVPSMTLEGYDDPWYLSFDPNLLSSKSQYKKHLEARSLYRIRETERRYFTKTPICYETDYIKNGNTIFHYRCDFFKEYHEHDEFLQIRITVTNVTNEIQNFTWFPDFVIKLRYPGSEKNPMVSATSVGDFYPTFEKKLMQETPTGDRAVYSLIPGESVVLERALPLMHITDLSVWPNGGMEGFYETIGTIELSFGSQAFAEIPIEMVIFDIDDPIAASIDSVR